VPRKGPEYLFVLAAVAGCTPAQASDTEATDLADRSALLVDLQTNVDQALRAYIESNHLPGAAVVIVHDGETVFKRGYGFANVENQTPVDPDRTVFRIGSISKALTLLTLSRLIDDGRLGADDDVARYVDGISNPNGFSRPVTMGDLLTHTTGFDQIGLDRQVREFDLSLDERKALRPGLSSFLSAGNLRRVSPAGQYMRYDTYGTTLAGAVLERVTGVPYPEAMRREMFEPLGITQSFVEAPAAVVGDLAVGYGWVDDAYVPQPYEVYVTLPASSIDATPADMGRLLEALTGDGANEHGRLFSVERSRAVVRPQFRPHPEFLGRTHGLEETEARRNGEPVPVRTVGHGGDMLGFSADLILLPEYDVGIFVVANRNGEAGGGGVRVGRPVREAAISTLYEGPTLAPIPVPERVTDADLSDFTGTYNYGVFCHSCTPEEFARGGWSPFASRTVTQSSGALLIGDDEFLPRGDDVFIQADGSRMAFFGRDDAGRVSFFVYSTSGDTFERAENVRRRP